MDPVVREAREERPGYGSLKRMEETFRNRKMAKGGSQETEERGAGMQSTIDGSLGFIESVECLRHRLARRK